MLHLNKFSSITTKLHTYICIYQYGHFYVVANIKGCDKVFTILQGYKNPAV